MALHVSISGTADSAAVSTEDSGPVISGAHALVGALEELGVDLVFGQPGVHNLPIWAAASETSIRLVTVRHEQTAVYAADGQARVTGGLGVAVTTTGPGAANTLAATGEAWSSGSPVLIIATEIDTSLRRDGVHRGALHECRDQAAMFAPVVKDVVRVQDVEGLANAVRRAASTALRPPTGPVYLEIPTDFLSATFNRGVLDGRDGHAGAPGRLRPAHRDLSAAVEIIQKAANPLIWAGRGAVISGADEAIATLARRIGAPVVETYGARGLMARDHPCRIGLPPHVPEVGDLWDQADVVIAIGTDFDAMMTQNWRMPQPRKLVSINLDAVDADKNYRSDVLLASDAKMGVESLTALLSDAGRTGAVQESLTRLQASVWERLSAEDPDAVAFLDALEAGTSEEHVIFADMCVAGYWAAAFHGFHRSRALAYPVGWGTLGFAFPASLGSALAQRRPTLCISGDGGFMFAAGELATAAQEQAPITLLLVDDGGYGMLRFEQKENGQPSHGVDLHTPHWEGLAHAFGIEVDTVEGLDASLAPLLRDHLQRDHPSMIVARASLRPPPTTSIRWYRRPSPSGRDDHTVNNAH